MLMRVIQNIVQNILRYAESKAIISYSYEENNLIFSIKNDIKRDSKVAVEKVFTRFYIEVTVERTRKQVDWVFICLKS